MTVAIQSDDGWTIASHSAYSAMNKSDGKLWGNHMNYWYLTSVSSLVQCSRTKQKCTVERPISGLSQYHIQVSALERCLVIEGLTCSVFVVFVCG